MSRKNRHIASFGDVANINNIDNKKDSINDNNSIIDNKNDNENDNDIDIFDQIIHNNKTDKVFRGIYFEREVANAIDRIARNAGKGKKGIKSQIVNEAVKKVFKEKGWL